MTPFRWGAPILAVGLAALAGMPVFGGYFGATHYSADSPPACSAQTHFLAACTDSGIQAVSYSVDSTATPTTKILAMGEAQDSAKTVSGPANCPPQETVLRPHTDTVMTVVKQTITRPVYETEPRTVTETIYTPVCETVMKECRTKSVEKVCETHYREYTVNTCKRVCEPVTETQRFQVCKQVCETTFRECSHTVCKPVTETHYRECLKNVCTQVPETAIRESRRCELREVTETVYQDQCKTVNETVTCNREVVKTSPECVCESVCVPGKLSWQWVPRYECVFDPCSCSMAQKQVGTVRKLVREPDRTEIRKTTKQRTVVEVVPEIRVVPKTTVEKVAVTVTKKVPVEVCDKVPVTVYRKVTSTERVQVPYTVTKNVPTVEVTLVPVHIRKKVLGAYVDIASLTTEAARSAADREYIPGGSAALSKAEAPTYEQTGEGRVFVEGLIGTRTVTQYVSKSVPVTEVRKVPYQVTKSVPRETVTMVPTTVTRMVPSTVTKTVQVSTCRLVTEEVERLAPTQVTTMRPEVVAKCPPAATRCGAPACPPCSTCSPSPCPTCSPAPCSCSLFSQCRPHPLRDFFHRLWTSRMSCPKSVSGACCSCNTAVPAPTPASTPATTPPAKPSTLPKSISTDAPPKSGPPELLPLNPDE